MIRRALATLAFLLLVASPAWAVTAHVQHQADGCAGTTACAKAFDSNVTAGNLIVVFIWVFGVTDTIDSVDDNQGNTYTLLDNPTDCASTERFAQGYAKNVAGGATTVTAHFSGSTGIRTLFIHEVSGVDTTTPLDNNQHKINCQTNPGTGTDAVTSGNITTTVNGDYIFGGVVCTRPTGTATVGTGYTAGVTASGYYCSATEYQIQGSAAAIAATFTIDFSDVTVSTGTAVAAFKPAAAAAANPCVFGGGFMRPGCF